MSVGDVIPGSKEVAGAAADGSRSAGGMGRSVRQAAMGGAYWVGVGTLGKYGLRIVSSVVLTRLIAPGVFGMMDLVMVFIVGLHLFSDIGLVPAVVQSPQGDRDDFLRTAWCLQAVRGLALALGACALAWPVAYAYERPVLGAVLPVMGLLPLVEGLTSPGMLLLQRRIERKWVVLLELIASLSSLLITTLGVYLAYPSQTLDVLAGRRDSVPSDESLVWTVVIAWVLSRVVVVALSHLVAPRPAARWLWDRRFVKEILSFGKWIFLSTLLTFFATQSDRLLLPKLIGFEAVGLYGRALSLLAAGTGIVLALQSHVVFPTCSRLLERGLEPRQVFVPIHRLLALISAVVVSGTLASGPALTRALYPAGYAGVDTLLQLVAIGAWFQLLQGMVSAFLLAAGKRRSFVLPQLVKTAAMLALIGPAWWLGKLTWVGPFHAVVAAFLLADAIMYGVVLMLGRAGGLPMLRTDLLLAAGIVAIAVLSHELGVLCTGASASGRWGQLLLFACQGLLCVACWGAVAAALHRRGALVPRW